MPRMLPPILRRLLVSSPLASILVFLAFISLLSISHPRTRQFVPSLIGAGNPAGAASLAKACDPNDVNGLCPIDGLSSDANDSPVVNHAAEWAEAKENTGDHVAAPPPKLDAPLPTGYAAFFADGNLPEALNDQALAALSSKLTAFLRRPALSHEQALEANSAACPPGLSDALVNPDQLKGEREFWQHVDADEVLKRRAQLVQYVADQAGTSKVIGEPTDGKPTRGIVFTAGNAVSACSSP